MRQKVFVTIEIYIQFEFRKVFIKKYIQKNVINVIRSCIITKGKLRTTKNNQTGKTTNIYVLILNTFRSRSYPDLEHETKMYKSCTVHIEG